MFFIFLSENMVENIEVSLINCAGREAIIGETFCNSKNYGVKLNVFGNFKNPLLYNFTKRSGGKYYILDISKKENILGMVDKCKNSDLVFIGNETPMINGLGNELRREHCEDVGVIGPNSEFALEKSKYETRRILDEVYPKANPEYYFIEPKKIGWERDVRKAVKELNGKVAIKPIEPKLGKGVIVEEFDFPAKKAYQKAVETADAGNFLIEEKIIGQECSAQFDVDKNLHMGANPYSRDFKRSEEKDEGPNTGGMAYFNDNKMILPFMKQKEFKEGNRIAGKVLRKQSEMDWYEDGFLTGVFYPAYILTGKGIKVLEFNNRHGDPEALVLRTLENDAVDVCFGMINGNLPRLKFKKQAVAGIYAAPLTYGDYMKSYTGSNIIKWNENDFSLSTKIYPGSIDLKFNGEMYIMKSRSVLVSSMAPTLEEAFENVNKDIKKINGPVRHRTDVDMEYVRMREKDMLRLRRKFN